MAAKAPEGVLAVDKPAGPTSHDVVARVKRELDLDKAGHLGTLDPAATGLLMVTINGGTKIAQFIGDDDKEYIGTLTLGVETDTQDAEGKVVATHDPSGVGEDDIRKVFASFVGSYSQFPPAYSAVKKHGTPLYKLARQGKDASAEAREVTIRKLDVLSIDRPNATFRVLVSKGTYIRTLAKDIGDKLGVGAHLKALRRTKVGGFDVKNAIPLDEISTGPGKRRAFGAIVSPVDALVGWAKITLKGEAAQRVSRGNGLRLVDFESADAELEDGKAVKAKAVSEEGELLAVMTLVNSKPDPDNQAEEIWRPIRVWDRR